MQRQMYNAVRFPSIALGTLAAGLVLTGLFALSSQTSASGAGAEGDSNRRHHSARARDAMALPFFSFAQGMRRSNRS